MQLATLRITFQQKDHDVDSELQYEIHTLSERK